MITRRAIILGGIASAGGLILPNPRRVYSFGPDVGRYELILDHATFLRFMDAMARQFNEVSRAMDRMKKSLEDPAIQRELRKRLEGVIADYPIEAHQSGRLDAIKIEVGWS